MAVPPPALPTVAIGPAGKPMLPLGFGGSWFMPYREASAADKAGIHLQATPTHAEEKMDAGLPPA